MNSTTSFSYPSAIAVPRHSHVRQNRGCSRRQILSSSSLFVFIFFLTGSLWMLLSFTETQVVEMGMNYSRTFVAKPLFVQRITVTNMVGNTGPVVYGFPSTPSLGKEVNWTEEHDTTLQSNDYQDWHFWLNKGSHVEIRYNVSEQNVQLYLLVVEGEYNMRKWTANPNSSVPVSAWNVVQGVGTLRYKADYDDNYHFIFANPQSETVQVYAHINLESKLHTTDNWNYRCFLMSNPCVMELSLLAPEVLLLRSPVQDKLLDQGQVQNNTRTMQQHDEIWDVSVAFELRWLPYVAFWGIASITLLIVLLSCNTRHSSETDESQDGSLQETLIDVSPQSRDKDKIENLDEESFAVEDYLCIICFEARRSCFFDPCGHSATCYSCSMKMIKRKKTLCPLCRQPIQYIRRLFLC